MLLAASCGRDEDAAPAVSCPATHVAVSAHCAPRFDACGEAEVPILGGGCQPVGVPPDGCAEGFSFAGGGCTAVLPSVSCAAGELAIPGDTACRPVAACGEGKYGPLPAGAITYVDAAHVGESDGSLARPFTKIQEAIDAAPDGGAIAVARGSYAEDLVIEKRVRLYGRCPSEVEVRGVAVDGQAIAVGSSVELHRVAVSGPGDAVTGADLRSLVLEEVWIHDVGGFGLGVVARRATPITLRGVLVERARKAAVLVAGAELTMESSVVRDTLAPTSGAPNGFGVDALVNPTGGRPATVVLRRSIVERSLGSAILVSGSNVSLDGVLVRDTMTRPSGERVGHGLSAGLDPKTKLAPVVSIVGSVFERNTEAALGLDDATSRIERTTIRDTLPVAGTQKAGIGLAARASGSVEVVTTLIEKSRMAASFVSTPRGLFDRVLVRDALPEEATGGAGFGIVALGGRMAGVVPDLTLRAVRIERTRATGVFAFGATLVVEGSLIIDTAADPRGGYGDGIAVHPGYPVEGATGVVPSVATIKATIVRGSARAGVSVFASTLALESSLLTCNAFDLDVERAYTGPGLSAGEGSFDVADRGGNACGCGDLRACKAVSSSLAPLPPP